MDYSSVFVCLMGMGTVFFGLICLIAITYLMSAFCTPRKTVPATSEPAPITSEVVAAVSAAVAEELGTDITGIRILSIKAA